MHKVSPTNYYYIYYICNTDWLCAPFFLNYLESEWFYRDEPFIKNVSFVETWKKCSKLVNNPFRSWLVTRVSATRSPIWMTNICLGVSIMCSFLLCQNLFYFRPLYHLKKKFMNTWNVRLVRPICNLQNSVMRFAH